MRAHELRRTMGMFTGVIFLGTFVTIDMLCYVILLLFAFYVIVLAKREREKERERERAKWPWIWEIGSTI